MKTKNLFIFLLLALFQSASALSFGQSAIQDTIDSRLARAQQLEDNDAELALELMQETLKFSISEEEKYGEWKVNNALGSFYLKQNQMDEAMEMYQKNIAIAQDMDSIKLEGLGLLRLSAVLMRLKRLKNAQSSATEALNIFKKINDKDAQGRALSNLGGIKTMLGLNKEGLNHFLTAYEIFDKLGEEDMKSQMNLNISYYYLMNGQGEASLPYVRRSLDYNIARKNPDLIARSYGNLAYAYSLMGNFQQAFENYHHSVDTAQKYQFTQVEYETYKDMSETYKKSGNPSKAFEYQTKYYTLRDSVIGRETQNRVSELQVQYETAEREREIEVLQQQKRIKNLQVYLLGIGLMLLGMIGWFIFQRQRGDLQEKQALINKNEEIYRLEKELVEEELKSKALERQKIEAEAENLKLQGVKARNYAQNLEDSNKELEQFAHIASHDLREPLRMVKSYMGLIKRYLDEDTLEKTKDFFGYAMDGADRMDKLILGVLNVSKVQRQELNTVPLDLNETVDIVVQNLHEFIEEQHGTVHYKDLPVINGDMFQMIQLFQNLINNGLKYNTSEQPTIWIDHEINDNQLELRVRDNGIGIAEEHQERVFQMFKRLQGRNFSGTGIGLSTCQKIVERHHGTIHLTSKEGGGTTFIINLPFE
jgi:signal transduction histidine kinase